MKKRYPFKFLDSYSKEDRDVFFGRDEEINALYQMVFQSDLVLVYGPSGSGKTSLIQCGLANRFQSHDWMELDIRRGNDFNESLEKSLDRAIGAEEQKDAGDLSWLNEFTGSETSGSTAAKLERRSVSSVQRKLAQLYTNHLRPIYLIFDQFEELFVLGDAQEEAIFIQTVLQILETEQPVTMIFSIREEYLGDLYEFERQVPQLLRKKLRVEPMSLDKVTQVVTGIDCYHNSLVHIRSGEVEAFSAILFEKIRGDDRSLTIQLPYLQVFLDSHYLDLTGDELRQTEVEFSVDGLVATGDIEDVLREFLNRQVDAIVEDLNEKFRDRLMRFGEVLDETVIWSILSPFASDQGTKEPQLLSIAVDRIMTRRQFLVDTDLDSKMLMRDVIHDTIEALVEKRILRDLEDGERYEIVHDSLAKRIAEKRSDDEIALLEVQRMIRSQSLLKEEARELFSEKQLSFIDPYLPMLTLNEVEQALVDDSHHRVDQLIKARKRRNKRRVMGGIILLLVMFGLTLLSAVSAINAKKAKVKAEDLRDDAFAQEQRAIEAQKHAEVEKDKANFALLNAIESEDKAKKAKKDALLQKEKADEAKKKAFEAESLAFYYLDHSKKAEADANFKLGKIFEEKASTAIGAGETDKAWMFTLKALNQHQDSTNLLPLSFGRSLDTDVMPSSTRPESDFPLSNGAWSLDFSPDGKRLAIATSTSRVSFLDLENMELEQHFQVHGIGLTDVKFSPDSRYLATSSKDRTIGFWDLDDRASIKSFTNQPNVPNSIDYSLDGQYIAGGYDDGSVVIWDLKDKDAKLEISKGHSEDINSVAFSTDGTLLASASQDGNINIYEVEGGQVVVSLSGNQGAANCIAFSPNGEKLACGYANGTALIWNVISGKIDADFDLNTDDVWQSRHTLGIVDIDFSNDEKGKWLVTGSLDSKVIVWSVEHEKAVIEIEYPGSVLSVAFSPDMNYMAVGQQDQVSIVNFNNNILDTARWEALTYIDSLTKDLDPQQLKQIQDLSSDLLHYEFDGLDLKPISHFEVAGSRALYYDDMGISSGLHIYKDSLDTSNLETFRYNLNGYPQISESEITLVPEGNNDAVGVVMMNQEMKLPFTVEFEYAINNKEGGGIDQTAEGIVFMFCKDIETYRDGIIQLPSQERGFINDGKGYGLHFATFMLRRVELKEGSGNLLKSAVYLKGRNSFQDIYTGGAWRKVKVLVSQNGVDVEYDGQRILSWQGRVDDSFNYIGFGASTGQRDGMHKIRNVLFNSDANPKSLKMQGASILKGRNSAQKIEFDAGVTYLITNAQSITKPLQAIIDSNPNGPPIVQERMTGAKGQRFQVQQIGTNTFLIVNQASGKALEAGANDDLILRTPDVRRKQQQFYLEKSEGDYYFITSTENGSVLEVESNSMEAGSAVRLSEKTGKANQQFKFTKFEL